MNYKEYSCNSSKLNPYIRTYFHVKLKGNIEFRFPSDGCPGLIVNLGEPFLLGTSENNLEVITGCCLFGYLTRQLMIKSIGSTEALAVKFRPGRLTPFSNVHGIELTDTSVAIEELWGKQGKELIGKIYESKSIDSIINILDSFFVECLSNYVSIDQKISRALDEILIQKGQITIDKLADWTNLSRRQFERRFKKTIGLPPKRMCRIARLAGLIPLIKNDFEQDWADLAFSGGFSDQAHFIRDWKYFTGHSPQSYIKNLSAFETAVLGL